MDLTRLPDFLIIGTMKGGTTALTRGISNHPQVFISPGKEVHFFDEHFERGLDWYSENFANATASQVVGEATPRYMNDAIAADRMVATLPDARFVSILRNPTDRAYSHYWHNRRRDRESRPFEDAIRDTQASSEQTDYVGGGRYVDRLRTIENKAGPDRLLVVLNEDLRHEREATLRKVWKFIGANPDQGTIDPPDRPQTLRRRLKQRRRARAAEYPPLDPGTRRQLAATYSDEIDALESWLGRDLTTWRR